MRRWQIRQTDGDISRFAGVQTGALLVVVPLPMGRNGSDRMPNLAERRQQQQQQQRKTHVEHKYT